MKRWLLHVYNVHGDVIHRERFWRRSTADTMGRFYTQPLPELQAIPALRSAPPMMTYDVTRWRR